MKAKAIISTLLAYLVLPTALDPATRPARQGQAASADYVSNAWDDIMQLEYAGVGETMIGEDVYGVDNWGLGTPSGGQSGYQREVFLNTGAVGAADVTDDRVRQEFSEPTYFEGRIVVSGFERAGKAHSYYPEDLEDYREDMKFVTQHASELPRLLRDTEEERYLNLYTDGENITGGHAGTPFFCDGSATNKSLQLIGRSTYFSGTAASNIIDWAGGVSYALIAMADQYGDFFVNEEGLEMAIPVTDIICNHRNGDMIEYLYGSRMNVESMKADDPNPRSLSSRARVVPTIHRTSRLPNANDIVFLFQGWRDYIKEASAYRARVESWEDGHAQHRKIVTQIRSRYLFYFITNRLAVLARGARTNFS